MAGVLSVELVDSVDRAFDTSRGAACLCYSLAASLGEGMERDALVLVAESLERSVEEPARMLRELEARTEV